jgi:hypothetical protein
MSLSHARIAFNAMSRLLFRKAGALNDFLPDRYFTDHARVQLT